MGKDRHIVNKLERQEVYLAKAHEADGHAAISSDATTKASWLRLAESYRQLARQT